MKGLAKEHIYAWPMDMGRSVVIACRSWGGAGWLLGAKGENGNSINNEIF